MLRTEKLDVVLIIAKLNLYFLDTRSFKMTTTLPQRKYNTLLLSGIRWETYQSLVRDLAEDPSQRLTYDCGILEIMTPLSEHKISKKLLDRLVEATTEKLGQEIIALVLLHGVEKIYRKE